MLVASIRFVRLANQKSAGGAGAPCEFSRRSVKLRDAGAQLKRFSKTWACGIDDDDVWKDFTRWSPVSF
ncbi:hypothetical protein DSO57_1019450 [Entomophthora muscae]|uniref:Uncharacterized protein n=1 Tax=Entomophthora muscae TaxID=34485 RepID=A0ACC2RV55_9FUNG|nr:hypothetical protein DSO57_1019450 [Entomophthora muscae]